MEGGRKPPAYATAPNVLVAIAVLVFGSFVCARAIRVPLTYDEAAAYLRYISSSPLAVFDFTVATNHFLNTLLVKLFSLVAGHSELVLRIPSLIGYGLYLWFSMRILRRLRHRAIAGSAFLLLNLNPYLLDYFALSRGYGLSLGLLVAALFFLLEFLNRRGTDRDAIRDLWRALLLTCAAVLANFSTLNVYLALFVVGLVAARTRSAGTPQPMPIRRRSVVWFTLLVPLYTLVILSQDLGLSERLYEPVSVRILSLNGNELETVKVYRVDHRGRAELLERQDHVWRLRRNAHVSSLRIELPVSAADDLASIEVVAGQRPFRDTGRSNGLWNISDTGSMRTLDSDPSLSLQESRIAAFEGVINWRGDSNYLRQLVARTAIVLCLILGVVVLLTAAGWVLTRRDFINRDVWRPLSASMLWMIALVSTPIYLLRRNGELYYGGVNGLVEDTFSSLIQGSFYGRTYHGDQTPIVFAGVLATIALFGVAVGLSYRRGTWPRLLPGISLLGTMVIVSIGVVAQRLLFETPYLLGRTAIFFIPLFLLFVAFAADAIAALGRVGRLGVGAVFAVAVSLSLYHFLATANVTYTFDWRQDAATEKMMADLVEVASHERPQGPRLSLGVDWFYYPVAVYYARRQATPIEVHVLPTRGGADFLYVEDSGQDRSVQVIRKYPVARSMLARPARAN